MQGGVGGGASGSDPSVSGSLPSEESGIDAGLLRDTKDTLNTITKQTSNITNIAKQRVKLNVKALGAAVTGTSPGVSGSHSMPEKQTFREQFTAPEMSIISKLMTKVTYMRLICSFFDVGSLVVLV